MVLRPERYGRRERRTASLLLFLAVLLHNAEEGLSYAATRLEATRLVQLVRPAVQFPTTIAFQAALLFLTVAVGAALVWVAGTHRDREGWLVLKAIASVLLVNVIIPHVPAAIALGGYAPGVITAVAVNLPLSLWILAQRPASSRN